MKIVFYNETIMSGGIEKCIELLSKYLINDNDIEVIYTDDKKLDINIVNILSKYASVRKLYNNEIIEADLCIWCRINFDSENLQHRIKANRNILWVHSKPNMVSNCALNNKDFMNKIEKIVCVSQAVKNEVGFDDKSVVIHNFINSNIKELAQQIENPFSNISQNCLKLLIVSRLSSGKGFERVEKIVKDLENEHANFVLKIIGKGRSQEPIIREKLGKYKQIEFLGYKENPYPYIKNSDYLLVLSDYETWGNVITEAKTLCTPCIVTDFPSAKEQIENGKNGIIIPLESNNYIPYIKDLKNENLKLKQSLYNFEYINEIDKWNNILKNEELSL